MRLTPSGSSITFEVLVALADFDASAELSAFAVPVNAFEVVVEPVFVAADAAGTATGIATGTAALDGN